MFKMQPKEELDNNITTVILEETDVYISGRSLQVTLLVVSVVLILLVVLGSTGNMVSLIILLHQRMRNQVNIMLSALCLSDTLFLCSCCFFSVINLYKKFNPVVAEQWRLLLYPYLGAYGSVVTARITSSLTTLLCVERCIAVFYPMQARIICSKRNTIIAIVSIYLLTAIAFIPFMKKYETVAVVKNGTITQYILNKTEFYTSNVKFFRFYGNLLNIIFRFAPLVIIPILNVCMIRAVHQAWKLRRDISGHRGNHGNTRLASKRTFSSTSQHRTTIMLVIVAFIFILCILPGAINSIVTHVSPAYSRLGKYRNLYSLISSLTFVLETLNSSINFIIYMAMCRKFRLIYKEKCCCGNGKYYNKISVSSVKDRFKWVSSRKSTDSDQNSASKESFRKTVSDSGPNRRKPNSRRALYDCVHSDEFIVTNRRKHSSQSMWILDSKCCMNNHSRQNSDEEKINTTTSDSVLNGGVAYYGDMTKEQKNGLCCNRKSQREHAKQPRHGDNKRKFHFTKDSLRNPRGRRDHISNPDYFKMTFNNIYNIDQELPIISDNGVSEDVRAVDRSKL